MEIREEKVQRVLEAIRRVRSLGRPVPDDVPEAVLLSFDLTEEEKQEVRDRLEQEG